jgi:photolyase PhrII
LTICSIRSPPSLSERTRVIKPHALPKDGKFVLYWLRTAMRVDENPALNAAIELGNRLQLPVLIYQGLTARYPYASDRHHTFILQGARDLQSQCARRELAYVLHVERPGHREASLKLLAEQAALVVTEDMPVEPLRRWTAALGRRVERPLVVVDTACVVPMRLVGKSYERAFAYRNDTRQRYAERISLPPVHAESTFKFVDQVDVPFERVDLQRVEIADLISQCQIDHSIGPVPETIGGSIAGYARWEEFKRQGLPSYDRKRNNALIDGVSRMSAYFHYGMVSPQRIAREAADQQSGGAEKYLDELLIWRELAYAFCFYRPDHWRVSALPDWAIATLAEHASDPRPALLSWETMARGRTGDLLWDAAQRSLLIRGELHNNVRMTWGKAILNWTADAKAALGRMIDLNHRYALDGRDPASFGGILWCLGQFDRPFSPPRPIFGTVRDRSTEQHAKRLDPAAYMKKSTRPLYQPTPRIAVIGAGISGLICARTLTDHGFDVSVFEKSRGVGGRMSTRRVDERLSFDHGAQYFTARDRRFQRYVDAWLHDGVVQRWNGRIVAIEQGSIKESSRSHHRFVAVPGMNAVGKHLAAELDVQFQTRITSLQHAAGRWTLATDQASGLGPFDAVVVALPAGQAANVLAAAPQLAEQAAATTMSGCWAVMLALADSLELGFDGAFVNQSPLAWIARNSNKPGRRDDLETWVLHASPEWTQDHIDDPPAMVEQLLLREFCQAVGRTPVNPVHVAAHRWRFALPDQPLADACLFDRNLKVGACGDWCGGPRVEGAFLSGMAMAGRLLGLANSVESSKRAVVDGGQLHLF